jgi:hypothetical protein
MAAVICRHCGDNIIYQAFLWEHYLTGYVACRLNARDRGKPEIYHSGLAAEPWKEEDVVTKVLNKYDVSKAS